MKVLSKFLVSLSLIMMMSVACANNDKDSHKEDRKQAFKACAEELGIKKEEGQRPSREDRERIRNCMEEKGFKKEFKHRPQGDNKFKEAMKACIEENRLKKPEMGETPSAEDRALMQECLKKKGFKKPLKHDKANKDKKVKKEKKTKKDKKDKKSRKE